MCNHEHLKTVTKKREEHLFCMDCGEELPMEFLTAGNGQKQAEKAAGDAGIGKSTRRKRTAQKGE